MIPLHKIPKEVEAPRNIRFGESRTYTINYQFDGSVWNNIDVQMADFTFEMMRLQEVINNLDFTNTIRINDNV